MTAARIKLIAKQPFFGYLSMHLEIVENTDFCPTTATDGQHLFFNPNFTKDKTGEELVALVTHEVMHAALRHPFRMTKAHNKMRYNIAADLIINDMIVRNNVGTLPSDCVTKNNVEWKTPLTKDILEYSADQIYGMLGDDPKVSCSSCEAGMGGQGWETKHGNHGNDNKGKPQACGGVLPSPAQTEADEWRARVEAAAQSAKAAGKLPGGLELYIAQTHAPAKNWKEILWEFVAPVDGDYSYTPPDRRFLTYGQPGGLFSDAFNSPLVIPGIVQDEKLQDIIFAIDTSGSMSDEDLKDGLSEAVAIGRIANNSWVMYCDAAMQGVYKLDEDGRMPPKPKGRGGTAFKPVFDDVEKRKNEGELNPRCLVYFTDGYGSFSFKQPEYPVLWVVNSKIVPDWGQHIEYP